MVSASRRGYVRNPGPPSPRRRPGNKADRVVSAASSPARPGTCRPGCRQHVVGAFDQEVLGDRADGRRLDVASNRVRSLISAATALLGSDDAALPVD